MAEPRPASAPTPSPIKGGADGSLDIPSRVGSAATPSRQLSATRLKQYQEYSATHIQDTVQDMMAALFTNNPLPEDPVGFMLEHLLAKRSGGEADGAMMVRLTRAAAQLDSAALAALVETAEMAAPAGVSRALDLEPAPAPAPETVVEEVKVTFTEPGSLGMKMNDRAATTKEGAPAPRLVALVVAINPGTQAEKHPQLKVDLVIKSVNGTSVEGMAYKTGATNVLGMLKAAGRPCTLGFVPLADADGAPKGTPPPQPDLSKLTAAADDAEKQAAASRKPPSQSAVACVLSRSFSDRFSESF